MGEVAGQFAGGFRASWDPEDPQDTGRPAPAGQVPLLPGLVREDQQEVAQEERADHGVGVHQDRAGLGVTGQVVQHVAKIYICMLAQRHKV